MKRYLLLLAVLLAGPLTPAHADFVWNTPLGIIGLPFSATEALVGYDAVVKQAIAGFSLPVYQDPKSIITLQVGAITPWQQNGPTVQPYVAAGHDILKEIPGLSQYKSAHLNVFGRWDTDQGKAGAGLSFSYAFAGGSISPQ